MREREESVGFYTLLCIPLSTFRLRMALFLGMRMRMRTRMSYEDFEKCSFLMMSFEICEVRNVNGQK